MVSPDVILVAALTIFLFVALCGALVLVVISLRKPSTIPLVVAGVLVTGGVVGAASGTWATWPGTGTALAGAGLPASGLAAPERAREAAGTAPTVRTSGIAAAGFTPCPPGRGRSVAGTRACARSSSRAG